MKVQVRVRKQCLKPVVVPAPKPASLSSLTVVAATEGRPALEHSLRGSVLWVVGSSVQWSAALGRYCAGLVDTAEDKTKFPPQWHV